MFCSSAYEGTGVAAGLAWAMHVAERERYRETVARAIEWICGMQSKNGGFASFDADNTHYYLNEIPFADHGALLDPPTSDVSARCAALLAEVGHHDKALTACLDYLREQQERNGSWFGRWGTNYVYGTNYLNLGYWAGYEAGLSQLAAGGFQATAKDFSQNQALSTFTAFANVKTLRDIAVVIELAGSEDPLKMWMEQVQPSGSVKIIAGVSASVEPKARAYHDTPNNQLAAVVSGLIGAAQYEVLTSQTGLALTSLNAQSVAQLTLVLIVVLGNIVFWISHRQRRNV